MTIHCPLAMQMLLHWYTTPSPYAEHEPLHATSDAVRSETERLLDAGMIQVSDTRSGYAVTERGEVYIKHIMHVPFPVKKWEIPTTPSKVEG